MVKRSNQFILFFSVFSLLQMISFGQQGWFQQESGTEVQLNSVFFLDSLNGWVVGNDSTVLKTSNGGEDWVKLECDFSFDYSDVFFISDTVGWIVGRRSLDGIIISTSNGGQSWEKKSDENMRSLYSITFVNDSLGFIAGGVYSPGWGIILKTENSGERWDTSFYYSGPWDQNFYDIDFINPNIGWVVGGLYPGWGNLVWKTTDSGQNWVTQLQDTLSQNLIPFSSCDFISENEGWVTFSEIHYWIGDYQAILHTKNSGTAWEVQELPDTNNQILYLNSIIFLDTEQGWCAGSGIFQTSDGGSNWVQQSIPIPQNIVLNSIFFVNESIGWAAGNNGTILKTTNSGVTFNEKNEIDKLPNRYYLSNNYPNPFNPTTTIKYAIPEISFVELKVYDVLGNEVAQIINEEQDVGYYELNFNAANLSSGVYFYRLKAVGPSTGSGQGFIETKKMLLLK